MTNKFPIDPNTGKPITAGVWPPRAGSDSPDGAGGRLDAQRVEVAEVSGCPDPPPDSGEPTDGPFLIPQPHGGAILSGAKMGNPGRPGVVPKRSVRDRAQKVRGTLLTELEGVAGDLTKLLESARPTGDGRPRCQNCQAFIPGVSKLKLADILSVVRELRAILPAQHEHEGLAPIQVNVVAGVQVTPNRTPVSP